MPQLLALDAHSLLVAGGRTCYHLATSGFASFTCGCSGHGVGVGRAFMPDASLTPAPASIAIASHVAGAMSMRDNFKMSLVFQKSFSRYGTGTIGGEEGRRWRIS